MKTTDEKLLVLSLIAKQLNAAGITWAIGASGTLFFHQITNEFHDLDIMVDDKDALPAKELLCAMGALHPSAQNGEYQTKHFFEFSIDGVEVDLIGGFAIVKDGMVYDCSLDVSDIVGSVTVNGQTVPLQSVQVWRRYYEMMGRSAKVALIDNSLLEHSPSMTPPQGSSLFDSFFSVKEKQMHAQSLRRKSHA